MHEAGSRHSLCQRAIGEFLLRSVNNIRLRALKYAEAGDGKEITVFNLNQLESEDAKLADELRRARIALVELLAEHDETLVETFLEADSDHLAISSTDITESLRRCVLE